MENTSSLKKNFFLLIVLTMSGAFIYSLPYFRSYYYDAFMATFQMTNTEMGLCGTYFGLFGAVSYLIGGVIADKFSIKKLIPFSMILTGGLGFYLLTSPSPMVIAIIHGIWGITSLMTFWPALMKAIRSLAASNEQGKAFGIFEGGRGITNAVYLAVAAIIFGRMMAAGSESMGIKWIITFFSGGTVLLGVVSIFLLRGLKESKEEGSDGFSLKMIGRLLKMPSIWLMIGIIFTTYTMNLSYYYISPYVTEVFGASTLFAAMLSSSSQYIRPVAAFGAGILGDRINSSKVMLLGQIVMVIGMCIVLFMPASAGIIPILIACVLIFSTMYVCQSMHFAIMAEIDCPPEIVGTAIGFICCIGYLPEAICPFVAGAMLDKYPGVAGYKIFFILLTLTIAAGILLTLIWLRMTKEKRAQILAINQAKKAEKVAKQSA